MYKAMDKKPHFVTELMVVQEPSPALAALAARASLSVLAIRSAELSTATTVESVDHFPNKPVESVDLSPDTTVDSVDLSPDTTVESFDHFPNKTVDSVDLSLDTTTIESFDYFPNKTVDSVVLQLDTTVEQVDLSPGTTTESVGLSYECSELTNKDSISSMKVEEIVNKEPAGIVELPDDISAETVDSATDSSHGLVELASSFQSSTASNDMDPENLSDDSCTSIDRFYCHQMSCEEMRDSASDSDIVVHFETESAIALEEMFFDNASRQVVKPTDCSIDMQSEIPTAFFIPYMATLPPPPRLTLIQPPPPQQNIFIRMLCPAWTVLRQVPWGAPCRLIACVLRIFVRQISAQARFWRRVLVPFAGVRAVFPLNEDTGAPVVNNSMTVATPVVIHIGNTELNLADQIFDTRAKSTENLGSSASSWETFDGTSDESLSISSNPVHAHDSESDIDDLEDLEETGVLPQPVIDAPADDLEGVDESEVCKVCFCRRVARKAFVPCGHTQLCTVCISAYHSGLNCPICRRKIMMIINVY